LIASLKNPMTTHKEKLMGNKGDATRFERVDTQQDPSYFVKFLDARKAIPEDTLINRQIIDWLQPLEGRQVLDVGCGTGDDSREIARLVGPKGRVVAIDFSAAMITEARKRNAKYRFARRVSRRRRNETRLCRRVLR
jgi:ubiquinone/menaquinone biosynthesis C-methylase UbiE